MRTASPHIRLRRFSWMIDRRLDLTSLSWMLRSLLRVTRNGAWPTTRKPPKSESSRGPITSSSRTKRRGSPSSAGRRTSRLRTAGTWSTA